MLNKLKQFGAVLTAILGALFLWERSRRKALEAVAENEENLKEVREKDAEIEKNKALIEAKEEQIKEVKKDLEDEKTKNNTKEELADFFNNRKPS